MIPLRATPRPKHHAPPFTPQLRHALQPRPLSPSRVLLALARTLLGPEPALALAVPHHKRRHHVLVRRRPPVLEVHLGERVVAWLVGVERLVLVEQVRLGEQPRVDVAVAQVEGRDALVVDVREVRARAGSEHILEEEERARCQEDAAPREWRVDARLAVERPAEVDAAAGRDAAHVVEERRRVGLRDFPLSGELPDVGFGFFVDVERREVTRARRLVERNIRGGAEFPVLGEGAKMLDPFFAAVLVGSLEPSLVRETERDCETYL